jgi:DNA-binding NtrC family response regulator
VTIKGVCALVVDDDPVVAAVARSILLQAGATESVVVSSGTMALEAARARVFDVAVVDLMLREENGLDLVPPLQALNLHIAIVLISGGPAPMGLDSDIVFLAKPFGVDDLRDAVLRALGLARPLD